MNLQELERAVEAVPKRPPPYLTELMLVYLDMRGRAWRAAFEWHQGVHMDGGFDSEYSKGLRLVEKLK
jgi:hypothetical protein